MSPSSTSRTPRVCVVDDDALVTRSIRSYLELESDFEVYDFGAPAPALDFLQRQPVDVVVSDFLMPHMNGLEFLERVRNLYPDVPRILLTGYADKENAIRSINRVGLFQYIEKPWDNEQLKLTLHNAARTRSLQTLLQDKITELDRTLRHRDTLLARDGLLTEELEVARRLVQGLLPDRLPGTDGLQMHAVYRPALDIGGDFYDVIPRSDGRWALLVADVTGHGIQAALSLALLKFAFHSVGADGGPAQLLSGMNGVLSRGLPEDVFVAALALVIDPRMGRIEVANGGLPHPLHVVREGRTLERVPAEGWFVGLADPALYRQADERVLTLEPGDRLLVYTDGLSEARRRDGSQFGDGNLQAELLAHARAPADRMTSRLCDLAVAFGDAPDGMDDITVVCIERKTG